jgi:hypothetical protein
MRRAALAAVLAFALLAMPALAAAQTPAEVLEAQAIKGAAKVQYTTANPGTDPERIVISRVVGDFASVDIFLQHTGTPTTVVVKREAGNWSGVAGPATAFPPEQRAGAPDDLFDYVNPYAWQNAEPAIVSFADQYPRYAAGFAGFGHPSDSTVQRVDDSTLNIVGPQSTDPTFQGPIYDISVRATGEKILGPMDEWGYAKLLQVIAAREAQSGPGGPGTQPIRAVYFQLPNANVFQVDWAGGDSIVRDFWLGPPGGGVALFASTRVYPEGNNPGAPIAESAVTLFLYTLQFPDASIAVEPEPQPQPITPGMPTTGTPAGLLVPLLLAALLPLAAGAALRLRATRIARLR